MKIALFISLMVLGIAMSILFAMFNNWIYFEAYSGAMFYLGSLMLGALGLFFSIIFLLAIALNNNRS
jgi:hypothetical protein